MKKFLFKIGYLIKRKEVLECYRIVKNTEFYSVEDLKKYQNFHLKNLISYAIKEIPYYTELFSKLKLTEKDIQTVEDLVKLPILTKEIIKNKPELFMPKNRSKKIVKGSTGGSTGVPLKYVMSDKDYSMGVALLYRGFGFAGYEPGDKVCIIAGSSLVSTRQPLKSQITDWILNFKHYSSYGMSDNDLQNFIKNLQKEKPKFLRGYASSVFILAKYIEENAINLDFQLKGVFTTSEKLFDNQRLLIEKVFKVQVYDNYGLNDGGISAYQCKEKKGMHIDYERAILEVTDDVGKNQLINKSGKILATSLFNYETPFIRYDTGDLGEISEELCSCGCARPMLTEIQGRVTDFLDFSGVLIGSPVLTVLMGKINCESYQIVQVSSNEVKFIIEKSKDFTQKDEEFIVSSMTAHVPDLKIIFDYGGVKSFIKTKNNKHKFIIKA